MIANAIINHLWQSTVFAAAAALLTLTCRKNRAVWRYQLWLAASAKFLVPFGWLVALGDRLGARAVTAAVPVAFTDVLGQSFVPSPFQPAVPIVADSPGLLPLLIATTWLAGVFFVLLTWWRHWQPIRTAYRESQPIQLDFVGQDGALRIRTSPALREPGVIGLIHPVLLLPDGITRRLSREQLHAVITHETCHVRQLDNLGALVHMFVEALFWFHPAVWLIERHLVDERERKCDEYVLGHGIQPAVYAQAILNVCKHYVESPLLCAPGVASSNLKTRIEAIMKNDRPHSLDIGRRLLLASAVVLAIGWPIAVGALTAPIVAAQSVAATSAPAADADSARFDVVSIKRSNSNDPNGDVGFFPGGRFRAHNVTTRDLLTAGYRVQGLQIVNSPDWITSDRFDIEAKAAADPGNPTRQGPPEILLAMLRNMLADRFRLRVHSDTRELPGFALMTTKSGATGPRLHQRLDCPRIDLNDTIPKPPGYYCGGVRTIRPGVLSAKGATMAQLAKNLSPRVGRVVVDQTKLVGDFDLDIEWMPGSATVGSAAAEQETATGASLFTALQEQLGLKLQAVKAPIEVLVIDAVERPTEN